MKNWTVAALVLVTAIGSFFLGSRLGATGHVQADAKFIASLTTAKLLDLDKGNLVRLRESLEFDRDFALLRHADGESGLAIYLWPEMIAGEYEEIGQRALVRTATYRKAHPTTWVTQEMMESLDPDSRREAQESGRLLESVTDKYAE